MYCNHCPDGVFVPVVTPFTERGAVDEAALERIYSYQSAAGVQGLFLLGTTGECVSLSREQRERVVEVFVTLNRGGPLRLFASVSGNCLEEAVEAGLRYGELGVEGVFAHVPHYFPLPAEEMEAWFLTLVERLQLPLLLYNIPFTTAHSLPVELVGRLARHPLIVGLKDSDRDAERMRGLVAMAGGCEDFVYLSGCGILLAEALLAGAAGVVPGTGNLAPEDFVGMVAHARAGEADRVLALQEKTQALSRHYQEGRCLSRSLPVLKAMLEALGLCSRRVLPPLLPFEGALPEAACRALENLHDTRVPAIDRGTA